MASISPPTPPHKLSFTASSSKLRPRRPCYPSATPPFPSSYSLSTSRFPDSTLCRCANNNNPSVPWRWDTALQDAFRSAMKRFDSYVKRGERVEREDGKGKQGDEEKGEWDWERWKRHFQDVDDQERLVSILKSQLSHAIHQEDYEDAARLKVAIAAAAKNDTVGRVMSHLSKAVAEERYHDAAFLRDNAGAGFVGWWSGISEDSHDRNGLIIHITAEHGRYVARSYSPRQLATAASGIPLFEIFLTMSKDGEYKQQAVYLKRKRLSQDPSKSSKLSGNSSLLNPPGSTEEKSDLFVVSTEDTEDGDDTEDGSDILDELPGSRNILRDMIPGVRVKVLKVTAPSKVDRDFLSKVIEEMIDEEDEDKDIELEMVDAEDEIRGESDQERDDMEIRNESDKEGDEGMDGNNGMIDNEEPSEISVKIVLSGLPQKLSGYVHPKESLRVPAKIEKKELRSFSFSIENDDQRNSSAKELASVDRKAKFRHHQSTDNIMFDLAKFIGKEKVPLKVLKDVSELINLTLRQAQNREPLSGSMTFNRIDTSTPTDPLSGLYIGAHGLYTSEVIKLQHKFGQWQDDHKTKDPSNLEFYEYVEAVKLTGDPYVPAGQVAFRAKVGKRYQLPHKGIIPEEFGVVARYRGQGRLAEPGFRKPRWVDGELVILDGKYIKGGPVIGFVYWAPEYHFLMFFSRLRLQ